MTEQVEIDSAEMPCPACGLLMVPLMLLENHKSGWHIRRCPECELAFVHPQPDAGSVLSSRRGMYAQQATAFDPQRMRWAQASVSSYLKVVARQAHAPRTRFLDLGGGLGYYAKAAEELGLSATLVETDPVSVAFARDVLGLRKVMEQSLHGFIAGRDVATYDLVLLRHVIEHSANPSRLLAGVADLLEQTGILIVETDNNAGVELLLRPGTARFYLDLYRASYSPCSFFSLLKRRPFAVDPPRHLLGFRMSNLSRLLEGRSLKPFRKVHYRLGHPVYWPNMPLPSPASLWRDALDLNWVRVLTGLVDYGCFPLRLSLERVGLSAGICIYAEKA